MLVEIFLRNLPANVQSRFVDENPQVSTTVNQLVEANASLFVNAEGEWCLAFGDKVFPNVIFYFQEVSILKKSRMKKMNHTPFRFQIKSLLREKKISQKEAAKHLGVREATISDFLRGVTALGSDSLDKLFELLSS